MSAWAEMVKALKANTGSYLLRRNVIATGGLSFVSLTALKWRNHDNGAIHAHCSLQPILIGQKVRRNLLRVAFILCAAINAAPWSRVFCAEAE